MDLLDLLDLDLENDDVVGGGGGDDVGVFRFVVGASDIVVGVLMCVCL